MFRDDASMLPRFDLQTHSNVSDGHQTFEEIFKEAVNKELQIVAVTDHHTNTSLLDVYDRAYDVDDIRAMKGRCRTICKGKQPPFLFGVEADIIDIDGCLNIKPEIAAEADFVIASLHIIPGIEMKWERIASGDVGVDRIDVAKRCMQAEIAALKNREVDVLGHPMYVISAGKYLKSLDEIDSAYMVEMAEKAAKYGVAVEVNGHFFRDLTPPEGYLNLFKMCLERGVKLSIGSDAHTTVHVGDLRAIHTALNHINARPEDIFYPTAKD